MRRSFLVLLITLACAMGLMACQTEANTPTATPEGGALTATMVVTDTTNGGDGVAVPAVPDSETGIIRGRALSSLTTEPLSNTVVALAQITRQDGEAVMVLNTASSPMNLTDVDGYFIITNVTPGEYVVVVGDPYEKYEVVEDTTTQMARFYFAEAGQVTEVGDVSVDIGK